MMRTLILTGIYSTVIVAGAVGSYRGYLSEKARIASVQRDKEVIAALHAALEAKEKIVAPLLASAHHGWAELDSKGRVKKWNREMEELTGRTEASLVGKDLSGVMPPENWKKHQAAFLERMSKPTDPIKAKEKREELENITIPLPCTLINANTKKQTEVFANVRIVFPSAGWDDMFAIAIVDKAENIVEPNAK